MSDKLPVAVSVSQPPSPTTFNYQEATAAQHPGERAESGNGLLDCLRYDSHAIDGLLHALDAMPRWMPRVFAWFDKESAAKLPPAEPPPPQVTSAVQVVEIPAPGTGLREASRDCPPLPPPDPFAALRRFAKSNLKGKERAVVEALCDAGGELTIAALGVKDGVSWDDAQEGFKGVQRRLNRKTQFKKIGHLKRHGNAAQLITR